jgi:cyclic pyranopterin phosphate synthase
MPKDELLSNEELLRVVNACAQVGFRKIRLTGGEPTLRRDLVSLVAAIKAVPGIEHIAMTTNAVKLAPIAHQLKAAGLDRVNISIDSLDPQRFANSLGLLSFFGASAFSIISAKSLYCFAV